LFNLRLSAISREVQPFFLMEVMEIFLIKLKKFMIFNQIATIKDKPHPMTLDGVCL